MPFNARNALSLTPSSFASAWLSAVLAVKWMVGYLQSHGMEIFGWYRVLLAFAVTAWLLWPF